MNFTDWITEDTKNVLLVEPNFPIPNKSRNHSNFLPIGLLKIAAYLKSKNINVELIRFEENQNEDEKIKKSLLSPALDAGGSVLCLGCFCTDHHQWSGERRHGRGCYRCLHCCQGNVEWYGDRL